MAVDQPELRATATAMQAISAPSVTDPATARIALRALAHRIDSITGVPIPTRQPNWVTDITPMPASANDS
ncbi:hypothetical protein RHCRD62_40044 [Rhodococcus sp. RD6.2]|nr:hypothetical protein RHCRD62_40044 [Rhodococcus sp. RD6.2]